MVVSTVFSLKHQASDVFFIKVIEMFYRLMSYAAFILIKLLFIVAKIPLQYIFFEFGAL